MTQNDSAPPSHTRAQRGRKPGRAEADGQKIIVNRTKVHLSLPSWLKVTVERRAANRGYYLSELTTRLYERWLEEDQARGTQDLT